ncbi:expressed unknown protein [Seminavis robusta]|uniref:Uncharacterized protein n=1 Tax=Seminavis robusta TaxID=568900 RepID=A0A9N8EJX3_9STRA|nr:expressed unknown protein [Seminavis robusta]|eukprot:Sro1328_g263210.1 n/a (639) ;mRNA; r:18755-20671
MRAGGRKNLHHPQHALNQSETTTSSGVAVHGKTGGMALSALSLIQRGNEYFFSDCYLEATGYYYQAAMLLKSFKGHKPERSKAWSNVAECHLRLQNWQAAEDASTNALVADPSNTKALYRRAKARFELADYVGAAKDADAVGTQESHDVAALCRELALAQTHGNGSPQPAARGGHQQQHHQSHRPRRESSKERTVLTLEERELWFRRIIDSYRLRVDDEYTQTGASDAGCLYGIRAKGGIQSPLNHFQSYVQRAVKKRVLPVWFTLGDMGDLCRMATTDSFSNINIAVVPEEIVQFYDEQAEGSGHDEVQELRNLAVYIEGPIGMPWADSSASSHHHNTKSKNNLPTEKKPRRKKSLPRVIPEPGSGGKGESFDNLYDLGRALPSYGVRQSGHAKSHRHADTNRFGIDQPLTPQRSPVQNRHYVTGNKGGSRYQKLQRSTSDTRVPRGTPSTPKANKRHMHVSSKGVVGVYHQSPYQQREPKRGRSIERHIRHPTPQRGRSFSPLRDRRDPLRVMAPSSPAWGYQQQMHHPVGAPPYIVPSKNKRSPSPMPISDDSESTPSDSFSPQLYYQMSMPSNLRRSSSELRRHQSKFHGGKQELFGGFYSHEDSSTAQEVRHGFLRNNSNRDEFSELTDLSSS